MPQIYVSLISSAFLTLCLSFVAQSICIKLAPRFGIMDIPSRRRRHKKAVPICGGLGIFFCWSVGLACFFLQQPWWFDVYKQSIMAISASLLILIVLGLFDDVYGIGPIPKLFWQLTAAAIVLIFEPSVHNLCIHWQQSLGVLVWPMGILWLTGITNAINLIDGLDGLAGGMSLLVCTSLMLLSFWTGNQALLGTVTMVMIIPSIIGFLKNNVNPAKIFLGDNGSLPLGFLIATVSLICRPQSRSWIMIASIVLMLGYPILDMGMCVFRRYAKKQPLFKADRNHLHFRIQRLGLSPVQSVILLLCIGLYLQVASLTINLMSPPAATLGIAMVVFSIFSFLYFIRAIELWHVKKLYHKLQRTSPESSASIAKLFTVVNIELDTLMEAGLSEEKERWHPIISALQLMLRTILRKDDILFYDNRKISIILTNDQGDEESWELIHNRINEKLNIFLDLYDLQCSLANLPITIERRSFIMDNGILKFGTSSDNKIKVA